MIPHRPRILLTNDDGVEAPGLASLEAIAAHLSDDVWVSAPASEQSGASRKLSLTDPIMVRKLEAKRFSVDGTPSDACFLGIHDLVEGAPPELVLSGVNRGQNLADDVTVSGTIAAAMQAMKMGVPAIALSQTLENYTHGGNTPFAAAEAHGPELVRKLISIGWPKDVVLNVNFPPCEPQDVAGVHVTSHGERDQWSMHADRRRDLRGRTYYWLGFQGGLSNTTKGEDLYAIYNNFISVTPLRLELTAHDVRETLAHALAETESA